MPTSSSVVGTEENQDYPIRKDAMPPSGGGIEHPRTRLVHVSV